MADSNYLPRPKHYGPRLDGTWTEPVPDDYWTVITKHYVAGSISAKTWFYEFGSLHSEPRFEDGVFEIQKHMPDGRLQTSYIPLTEVLRIDYNGPSQAYIEARDAWCIQQTGFSFREQEDLMHSGMKEVLKEGLRRELSEKIGIPLKDIVIVDMPDGSFAAAVKMERDNDE